MKTELLNWLSRPELNQFLTVTLRQAIINDQGYWQPITPEDVRKTAWLLRDRFAKSILGSATYKKGQKLPFVAFAEGNGRDKRFHLHIVASKPWNMSDKEFSDKFRFVALRLDWVYGQIDIRPISNFSDEGIRSVLTYSLKEGVGAFLPEASHIAYTE